MRATIKNLQDINTLADTKAYTAGVRKSAKPALPTTHILELSMRRNERDRILTELKRLKKRRELLKKRLVEMEKSMDKLLVNIAETAQNLRGRELVKQNLHKKKGKMVLEY